MSVAIFTSISGAGGGPHGSPRWWESPRHTAGRTPASPNLGGRDCGNHRSHRESWFLTKPHRERSQTVAAPLTGTIQRGPGPRPLLRDPPEARTTQARPHPPLAGTLSNTSRGSGFALSLREPPELQGVGLTTRLEPVVQGGSAAPGWGAGQRAPYCPPSSGGFRSAG